MRRGYLYILSVLGCVILVSGQVLASDPGVSGPPIELVHIYNDEFPTGMFPICPCAG